MVLLTMFFSEHAAELNNAVPTTPILFMKPPSCYLPSGGTIEVQLFILMISWTNINLYHKPGINYKWNKNWLLIDIDTRWMYWDSSWSWIGGCYSIANFQSYSKRSLFCRWRLCISSWYDCQRFSGNLSFWKLHK